MECSWADFQSFPPNCFSFSFLILFFQFGLSTKMPMKLVFRYLAPYSWITNFNIISSDYSYMYVCMYLLALLMPVFVLYFIIYYNCEKFIHKLCIPLIK